MPSKSLRIVGNSPMKLATLRVQLQRLAGALMILYILLPVASSNYQWWNVATCKYLWAYIN